MHKSRQSLAATLAVCATVLAGGTGSDAQAIATARRCLDLLEHLALSLSDDHLLLDIDDFMQSNATAALLSPLSPSLPPDPSDDCPPVAVEHIAEEFPAHSTSKNLDLKDDSSLPKILQSSLVSPPEIASYSSISLTLEFPSLHSAGNTNSEIKHQPLPPLSPINPSNEIPQLERFNKLENPNFHGSNSSNTHKTSGAMVDDLCEKIGLEDTHPKVGDIKISSFTHPQELNHFEDNTVINRVDKDVQITTLESADFDSFGEFADLDNEPTYQTDEVTGALDYSNIVRNEAQIINDGQEEDINITQSSNQTKQEYLSQTPNIEHQSIEPNTTEVLSALETNQVQIHLFSKSNECVVMNESTEITTSLPNVEENDRVSEFLKSSDSEVLKEKGLSVSGVQPMGDKHEHESNYFVKFPVNFEKPSNDVQVNKTLTSMVEVAVTQRDKESEPKIEIVKESEQIAIAVEPENSTINEHVTSSEIAENLFPKDSLNNAVQITQFATFDAFNVPQAANDSSLKFDYKDADNERNLDKPRDLASQSPSSHDLSSPKSVSISQSNVETLPSSPTQAEKMEKQEVPTTAVTQKPNNNSIFKGVSGSTVLPIDLEDMPTPAQQNKPSLSSPNTQQTAEIITHFDSKQSNNSDPKQTVSHPPNNRNLNPNTIDELTIPKSPLKLKHEILTLQYIQAQTEYREINTTPSSPTTYATSIQTMRRVTEKIQNLEERIHTLNKIIEKCKKSNFSTFSASELAVGFLAIDIMYLEMGMCKEMWDYYTVFENVVKHTILTPKDSNGRAKCLVHWLDVCTELYEYNNFQSICVIIKGMSSPIIQKLENPWNLVARNHRVQYKLFSELQSLVGPKYVEYIAKCRMPVVPIVSIRLEEVFLQHIRDTLVHYNHVVSDVVRDVVLDWVVGVGWVDDNQLVEMVDGKKDHDSHKDHHAKIDHAHHVVRTDTLKCEETKDREGSGEETNLPKKKFSAPPRTVSAMQHVPTPFQH